VTRTTRVGRTRGDGESDASAVRFGRCLLVVGLSPL